LKKIMSSQFSRILSSFLCLLGFVLTFHASPSFAQTQAAIAAPSVEVSTKEKFDASAVIPTQEKQDPKENPYGIRAVWEQGDFVARATLLILLIMSMSSWYVIATKFLEQGKLIKQSLNVQTSFWNAATLRQSTDQLDAENPFRFIAEKALEGANKHAGLLGAIDFNTWVTMSIQRAMTSVQNRLQNGLALLATVGSTAPFVGLFGTVWGIYHALVSIGLSGQASIDKVAGPVGESLIMTAIGLAVAVPAVLGYNWLVRRNKLALESVHAFGNDLHVVMLATAGK
jgi:biopolymer transport protein ExbB